MSGKIGAKGAHERFRAGVEPAARGGERAPEIKVTDARGGNLQTAVLLVQQRAIVSHQPVSQIVQTLCALGHQITYAGKSAVLGKLLELIAGDQEPVARCAVQPLVQVRQMLGQSMFGFNDELRSRGRRGGAQVGNKVSDGEISFMAYSG